MSNDRIPSTVGKRLAALLLAAAFSMVILDARSALLPRDIDGDGVVDAYYDTAQNITWLRDWDASGQLTWAQALAWVAGLNVGGVTGWRLPNVTDTGNAGCDFSTAGGTDCGYNVDTKTSEMARLWYVTLANLGFCARGDANCNLQGAGQSGWGLSNTGPFRNMQVAGYWSGTQYALDAAAAWNFSTNDGSQDSDPKTDLLYAVAVHAGDVASTTPAYKVVDLTPAGLLYAVAWGAGVGQQAGWGSADPTNEVTHALLWTGSAASVIDLHPPGLNPGWVASRALGVGGRQQVGDAIIDTTLADHAMLWKGTAASAVDLHPLGFVESQANGVGDGQQVGTGRLANSFEHALLWSGSAASAVDLNPPGILESQAYAAGGDQQVGQGRAIGTGPGTSHALLWMGSAASVVDLHPAGFSNSSASGVAQGQQVGTGDGHALLWTGSAASVVDLHPAGFQSSSANAIAGGQQAGDAFDGTSTHPMVWSGSAASAVDLQPFLPSGFPGAHLSGIDDAGTIVGWAGASDGSGEHALMWVPALPYGLIVSQSDAPDPVLANGSLTYTITVTNDRSGTATGVTVVDALPLGSTLVSATPSQGNCAATVPITCNLGSLPGNGSGSITIVVSPTQAGIISNVVSAGADDRVNSSATESTTVNPSADLAITNTDSPDPAKVGSNVTYTINVTNSGPSSATNVAVQDTLPNGLNLVSAIPSQGSCSGAPTVNCSLGTLTKGGSAKITIVVTPSEPATISNTVTVAANEPDPNTLNNSATQQTTINAQPLPDLTGAWVKTTQACKTKRGVTTCTINGSLIVLNQGNAASGACIARLYLSDDASFSVDDLFFGQVKVAGLKGGASKSVKVKSKLQAGTNTSGKFVIAVLDSANVVSESDETNNVIVSVQLP